MTRLKHILVGRNPKRTMIRAAFLAIASFIIFGWLARPVRVQGISMEPTVHDGSIHFLNLTAYWWREPQRRDMVAVAMPGGRSFYMKRILGMPGETISFRNGQLFINGKPQDESYLNYLGNWELASLDIPDGNYFIAGDNRNTPFSGHSLGLVERKFISGSLTEMTPLRFNRSFVIRIVLILLAGLAVYRLWPNDIRTVEKNTRKLLAAVNKMQPESLPVSAAKSLEAGSYLASNVILRLGDPFPGQVRKSEAVSMLQQARMQADRLTVTSRGHQISRPSDSEIVMEITLEAEAAAGDRKEEIINSYRLTWGKIDGGWKITKAEVNNVIRHPSGELQPF